MERRHRENSGMLWVTMAPTANLLTAPDKGRRDLFGDSKDVGRRLVSLHFTFGMRKQNVLNNITFTCTEKGRLISRLPCKDQIGVMCMELGCSLLNLVDEHVGIEPSKEISKKGHIISVFFNTLLSLYMSFKNMLINRSTDLFLLSLQ